MTNKLLLSCLSHRRIHLIALADRTKTDLANHRFNSVYRLRAAFGTLLPEG